MYKSSTSQTQDNLLVPSSVVTNNKRRAIYIVIEGIDGVGKTTQCAKLAEYLRTKNYKVLETKEPGTIHLPLTMSLRSIMLDNQYESELTSTAREYISQAIRSIHLEKLIKNALNSYDYIIQDRGLLSGLSYGVACGNAASDLLQLMQLSCKPLGIAPEDLYTHTIVLKLEVGAAMKKVSNRQLVNEEFKTGDAIEARGVSFMKEVQKNMAIFSSYFHAHVVEIKPEESIQVVFAKIQSALNLA